MYEVRPLDGMTPDGETVRVGWSVGGRLTIVATFNTQADAEEYAAWKNWCACEEQLISGIHIRARYAVQALRNKKKSPRLYVNG